jgi:hypothetical protein
MVEMLKRYAYIIAALVFLFPTTAAAQVITDGESLRKRCGTFQIIMPSSGLGCRGYIGAVLDIMADGNAVYEYRACPPHDEEREALIIAVKSWLDRHPNSLNRRASAVTAQALAETYPCAP